MKVAYLILAHAHPELLTRLIRRLDDPRALFYVHIDAKTDLKIFKDAVGSDKVVFLSGANRVSINWCGFSMVQASLNLLASAFGDVNASRFVLLSGTDYPAVSASRIVEALSADHEFIKVDRQLNPDGNGEFDRCANRLFLGDIPLLNPRSGNVLLRKISNRLAGKLKRHLQQPIYYGSSWWALTRVAVSQILEVYKRSPQRVRQFCFARSPDEMVFQTLVKASDRASHIAFDATVPGFAPASNQAANHYVNWDRPNPLLPRTVDENDYENIVELGALFVRKIDPIRSAGLMEKLDRLADGDHPPQDN